MATNAPTILTPLTLYAAPQPFTFSVVEQTGSLLPVLTVRIVRILAGARALLPPWLQPTVTANGSSLTASVTLQQSEVLLQLADSTNAGLAVEYVQAGGVTLLQQINYTLSGITTNGVPLLVAVGGGGNSGNSSGAVGVIPVVWQEACLYASQDYSLAIANPIPIKPVTKPLIFLYAYQDSGALENSFYWSGDGGVSARYPEAGDQLFVNPNILKFATEPTDLLTITYSRINN